MSSEEMYHVNSSDYRVEYDQHWVVELSSGAMLFRGTREELDQYVIWLRKYHNISVDTHVKTRRFSTVISKSTE